MKRVVIFIIIAILIIAVIVMIYCRLRQVNTEIVIFSPKANQVIKTPLVIEGKARGFWFFEASFPVKLLDSSGKEIVSAVMQAQSDWMTTDFVRFKGELNFISRETSSGTLVFRKDNPSGLPENDKEFRVPIKMEAMETVKVKVYFNNSQMDPEVSCNKVFPIEREVVKTQAVARAAIEELLKGPLSTELSQGFFTSINSGVKIQELTIEDGIAKIDFDDQIEFQVGGSCRVSAIRAQINETLKQFPTVKSVIISVNSRTDDALQP